MSDDPLLRRSIEIIRAGQSPSGAYVASPAFRVYRYAWLRDGAFVAHAMDAVGERESAAAFHEWASRAVSRQRRRVDAAVAQLAEGRVPDAHDLPPARFTLIGEEETTAAGEEAWPTFQLDGYGQWLWAVERHLGDAEPGPLADGIDVAARYLAAAWRLPCWNCWEEFDGGEHAYTIAAAASGLAAAARLLGRAELAEEAARAHEWLLSRFVIAGRFGRGAADARADGSLLWLAVPLAVLPLDDARLEATVDAVRDELQTRSGGVRRYVGDSYYGGGEWLLLTCSLGLVDAARGDLERAAAALEWTRAQATVTGELAEQTTTHPQVPEKVAEWLRKWGPVATPLLWSHAMYVLLACAIARGRRSRGT